MFLRWLARLPLHLAAVIIVYLTAPLWGLLSVALGRATLPGWLRYLHTTDDDLDGGQHQLGWKPKKGLALAMQRAFWMWRNPAGGVASALLGLPVAETRVTIVQSRGWFDSGDAIRRASLVRWVGDHDDPDALLRPVDYFEYRRDLRWCPWFYVKLWIGWTVDTRGGWHRFQCQCNPFRRIP